MSTDFINSATQICIENQTVSKNRPLCSRNGYNLEIIKTQYRAILYKSHSASAKFPYFTAKEVFVYSENYGMYMNWLSALFTNPFLIVPMLAWFTAQVLKTIIHAIINKKLDITRMCGDGGMPSGHSATVSSLAVLAALVYGCGSFQFAFAAVLAIIVCHDASGVRLQTGKQAEVLNDLIEIIDMLTTEKLPEVKLKEFVGHTPVQVAAGIIVGVVNALVWYYVWY